MDWCENGRLIASTRTAPLWPGFLLPARYGPFWGFRGLPRARRRLRHLDVPLAVLLAFLLLPPAGGRKRFGSAKLHIACSPTLFSILNSQPTNFSIKNPHPPNLSKPSNPQPLFLRKTISELLEGCLPGAASAPVWVFGSGALRPPYTRTGAEPEPTDTQAVEPIPAAEPPGSGGCSAVGSGNPRGVPPGMAPLGAVRLSVPFLPPKAAVGFRAVRAVFGPGFRPPPGGRSEGPAGAVPPSLDNIRDIFR